MVFGRYVRKMTKARQEQLARSNVIVEETLQNISTVKAYTNEDFELARYGRSIDESVDISIRTANARGLFSAFIVSVMFGALFFIIYRAILLVQSGDLPVGDLFTFIVLTGIIGGSVASLGSFYGEIVGALGASDRVVDILDSQEYEGAAQAAEGRPDSYRGRCKVSWTNHRSPPRSPEPSTTTVSFSPILPGPT